VHLLVDILSNLYI